MGGGVLYSHCLAMIRKKHVQLLYGIIYRSEISATASGPAPQNFTFRAHLTHLPTYSSYFCMSRDRW